MFIGKVLGPLVTAQKEPAMAEAKLLVIEAYNAAGPASGDLQATGKVLVAIDMLGAGVDEYVLVTQGSSARLTETTKNMPVDAIVIGIVESVQMGKTVHSRSAGTLGK